MGKVPVLKHDDFVVWDTLAICEYLAELFPERDLWPQDFKMRSYARAICAEMHSGFMTLRSVCPMNMTQDLSEIGQKYFQENQVLQAELERIDEMWSQRPNENGFLCGNEFSIADAFYAPVVMRFKSYGLAVSESSQHYMQTILNVPTVQTWMNEALKESL